MDPILPIPNTYTSHPKHPSEVRTSSGESTTPWDASIRRLLFNIFRDMLLLVMRVWNGVILPQSGLDNRPAVCSSAAVCRENVSLCSTSDASSRLSAVSRNTPYVHVLRHVRSFI